ncbi:MAG TPA: hypothetical protein PKC30_05585 [Saprospiraceae bacterium]|nr:hypothetical protein [Saprospiraceae bacterium]
MLAKYLIFLTLSLTALFPSKPLILDIMEENMAKSEIQSRTPFVKKSVWKQSAKTFTYEVQYNNADYIVKYYYGDRPFAEVLDARNKSLLKVFPEGNKARFQAGSKIKLYSNKSNIILDEPWNAIAVELLEMDLINLKNIGANDFIDSGNVSKLLVPDYAIKQNQNCTTQATCNCNGNTISISCECGKSAQCVSSRTTRCVEASGGGQECTEVNTCSASCL